MPGTSRIPLCRPAPIVSAGQQPPHPLCPSRTFGPSEKQLVGGIQAEHRLGVSFCHRDALQRGCPGILGATHWVNDAPCVGKKEQAWWGVCGKALCYTIPGAWESKSCLTPSIFHCLAVRWAHLNPAYLRKGLCGNPGNLPRSSPCLLPLPQQYRLGKLISHAWPAQTQGARRASSSVLRSVWDKLHLLQPKALLG